MCRHLPGTLKFLILALTMLPAVLVKAATGEARPNVVVLLADDLGYGSVSWTGGDIPTPNIDSIANNGIDFVSGHMTAPVCNPSRAGLMTGRYQQRWGKELNSQTARLPGTPRNSLPKSEMTLGTAMKRLGYATGAIGKWQLGMTEGYHPLDRGFDFFLGMPSGSNFVDASWPNARIAPGQGNARRKDGLGRPRGLFRGRERIPMDEYLTDQLGRAGIEFIERHKSEPFFLYLAFHAPHTPIETIDKYYERFPNIENETMRIYAAMISAVDDWVGAVLAKLRQHGLEENTLVIFASDNGAALIRGTDGARNKPFIGNKRNLYEGGIRVPYVMQWKGRLNKGQRYTAPISSLDIFPTALAAAGAIDLNPYKLDGVNLIPYLTGEKTSSPHEYLFWRSGPNAAVLKGSWKLLLTESKLTRLYNVDKDLAETTNLASEQKQLVNEMKKAFDQWAKDKEEPRRSSRTIKTRFNGDVIEWHI